MTIRVDRRRKLIVIECDESEAWDLAHAFPPDDGFSRDMIKAIAECWPDETEER